MERIREAFRDPEAFHGSHGNGMFDGSHGPDMEPNEFNELPGPAMDFARIRENFLDVQTQVKAEAIRHMGDMIQVVNAMLRLVDEAVNHLAEEQAARQRILQRQRMLQRRRAQGPFSTLMIPLLSVALAVFLVLASRWLPFLCARGCF